MCVSLVKFDFGTLDLLLKLLVEQFANSRSIDWTSNAINVSPMTWTKAECERKNLKATPIDLPTQLNGSFDRIPFDELCDTPTEFNATYNGFSNSTRFGNDHREAPSG